MISVEEVIQFHDWLIKRYGGSLGLRDLGLLESALGRVSSGYYETIFEQVAALFESLILNHAFVDGNKRTAVVTAMMTLKKHGYRLTYPVYLIPRCANRYKKTHYGKLVDLLEKYSMQIET